MDDNRQIRVILAEINAAWRDHPAGGIAALIRPHFTDDAIIVGPDLRRVARGGDAVALSFDQFVLSTTITEATLDDPEMDVSSDVAIATLRWHMTYVLDGKTSTEAGHDVYVLRKGGARWRVCWRQIVSAPA